jgi:hypothetical protein
VCGGDGQGQRKAGAADDDLVRRFGLAVHPVRPVHRQGRLAHPGGARDGRDDDGGAPGVLGRVRQDRVEAGQFRGAPGEGRHRGRQLGRDQRVRCLRRGRRQRDRRSGRVERRILSQDGRFQLADRLTGIYPQVLREGVPQPLVGRQRVRLPSAPVERHHQLGVDLLVQRVLGGHLLQFGQQLQMFPGGQPGLGQRSPDPLEQQVQPSRLLLKPGQPGHVRQRPPAPQRQRLPQVPDPADRIGGLRALPQQPLGQPHVGAVVAEVKHIAGRTGQDRLLAAQHGPQVRDVTLQRVQGHRRRGVPPDGIHQPAGADDFVPV